jgi:hypothetical protein
MANSDLKIRTKDYALSVIQLFAELPKRTETQILGRQLLRSGTSVGVRFDVLRILKTCKFPPGFQSVERFERSPVEYGPRFHGAIERLELLERAAVLLIVRNTKANRKIRDFRPVVSFYKFILYPFAFILSPGPHDHDVYPLSFPKPPRSRITTFILYPFAFILSPPPLLPETRRIQ